MPVRVEPEEELTKRQVIETIEKNELKGITVTTATFSSLSVTGGGIAVLASSFLTIQGAVTYFPEEEATELLNPTNDLKTGKSTWMEFISAKVGAKITGFSANATEGASNHGMVKSFMNMTGTEIVFANENAGSKVGNRIHTRGGADIKVQNNETVSFIYSKRVNLWLQI